MRFVFALAIALTLASGLPGTGVQVAMAQKYNPADHIDFSYDYRQGPYVRIASGYISDPVGFHFALVLLKAPPGAHGAYGLLGDDYLLGKESGYGLRQLGATARIYIHFTNLYVQQPGGFENFGVQPGTFTNVDQMNDATLGWVLFDLRKKFEDDLDDWVLGL